MKPLHLVGLPGTSVKFFAQCLAHHPLVQPPGNFYFEDYDSKIQFLKNKIIQNKQNETTLSGDAGAFDSDPALITRSIKNKQIPLIVSQNIPQIERNIAAWPNFSGIVQVIASTDYRNSRISIDLDNETASADKNAIMTLLIKYNHITIEADKFVQWEMFKRIVVWAIETMTELGSTNDNADWLDHLQQFHAIYYGINI